MKTLEQIKDDYAIKENFEHWNDLLECNSGLEFEIDRHENEVMKIYAMECLKLASENADKQCWVVLKNDIKKAILNENNIIK